MNGDGYDDLIIGALRGAAGAGETYVVYGGSSAPGTDGMLALSALDGSNGFTLNGIDVGDFSSTTLSSAGDVNGDGYDDLIIGAHRAGPNGQSSGESYVVYGGASAPGTEGVLALSMLNGINGFILNGIDAGDYSYTSMSPAGDVNGDGYDDLIVTALGGDPGGRSEAGETYLVYGGASAPGTDGVLELSTLDGSNGFTLNGIDAEDRSGTSVSLAGDVNGDGYDDLIIGAYWADPDGQSRAGESYVVYGGASAPGTDGVLELSTLDGANGFILTGIDVNDYSGSSVSSAGDVNGDGYDDLIIGALWADPDGNSAAGETYVVYGGANAPGTDGVLELSTLEGSDGSNGFVLNGIDAGDRSGGSVSSAGDVNGDGYDDLIIGAGRADPGGNSNAGETYLVYGGATETESTEPVAAQGTAAADNFTGNGGADSFTGIATGDVVRGGPADDTISVTALDFADIDGGAGRDTLVLAGANLSLDLTGPGNGGVDSVELVDLSGSGGNTLVLDALAVFDLTQEREGGIATLDVLGDGDDRLELLGSNFALDRTETADATTWNVYRAGNAEVRVATDVQVENLLMAIDLSILDGGNGFTLNGIDPGDGSGFSVSSAGDVNGDGYNDLIIGAGLADRTTPDGTLLTDVGETYVVYGGASAPGTDGMLDLATLDGSNGFILNGIDANDNAGFSVSSAGDVNGDGYDDLIIGAYRADPDGNSGAGETYVVYGAASAPGTAGVLNLSALNGADGFTLNGIDGEDFSGYSVSSAGDVNGDGYDDLIIGAVWADPAAQDRAGETYVVYGGAAAPGADGTLNLSALDGANGFILAGAGANDRSGNTVSSAGDVNGDGYDDLIIGAGAADPAGLSRAGETYLVYGGASAPGTDGVLALSDLDGVNGFVLTGIEADDESGVSVSSAGDVNGDGYDDLIIGANRADRVDSAGPGDGLGEGLREYSDVGETYLVFGGAGAPGAGGVLNLAMLDGTNGFILNGIDADDQSGISVSSAGDVNGDGFDDLIIGAGLADSGDSDAGETYVVYGGAAATGGVLDLATLDGSNGFVLNGIDRDDQSGRSVSSAGDVNGDGYDDLIIGAGLADPGGDSDAGQTYVLYGGATGTEGAALPVTPPVTARGTAGADNFTGNAGADSFTGIATADVVRGGAGDDTISVTAPDFADIDGGTGRDTLVLDGANLFLDLRGPGNGGVGSVEVVDLSGAGGNTLALDAPAVFDLTEERAGGVATIDVLGDADDRLELRDSDITFHRTETVDGASWNVYRSGNAEVRVETDVRVVVAAVDLSMLDGGNGFTINGVDVDDFSGVSVSSAGDVNGDGFDDLIIGAYRGAPGGQTRAGESYVVYGGAAGAEDVLELSDLDGGNGFTLNGIDPNDFSGFSVSSAGDVNGDGYGDLIIGAFQADPAGGNSDAGETYVVYGGASAPGTDGVLELSALDGGNGFTLTGIGLDDRSGVSVSSAGDVNGDGYDDLIIGANDADGNDSGETYVVYGGASAPGTDGVLALSALDGGNGFALNGIDAFDESGISVSSAGDVNGDGYDDLVVGAHWADPNGNSRSGETYLVYGGASAPGSGGVLDLSALDGGNGFVLNGIDVDDYSGVSVSSAGDVNGDGYDDLIIGARQAEPGGDTDAGETYVVYGRATGTEAVLNLSTLDGANGFVLTGVDADDDSGLSVSSAGDVNGDGYDDLIIGAYRGDPGGNSAAGETYVVYGGATAPGGGATAPGGGATVPGGGATVPGGGATAPGGGATAPGGGATAPGADGVLHLSALDGVNGFVLKGIDADDRSGFSVSSAGDVNGDGYDDLIIGAYVADPNGNNRAGETYLVYGGATGTESLAPVTASGTAAADNFTGNAGADSFTAIATDDVVRGGAGDDSISVTSLDFADIDGGTGRDTLALATADLSLDLTGPGNGGVDSVEVVDLTGSGDNTLVLNTLAVFDLTEEREGGVATLDVLGDAGDTLDLTDGNFAAHDPATETQDGTTYNVYRDGNAEVRVQDGVTVMLEASGASGQARELVAPGAAPSQARELVAPGGASDQARELVAPSAAPRLSEESSFEDLSIPDLTPHPAPDMDPDLDLTPDMDLTPDLQEATLLTPVPGMTPTAQPVSAGDPPIHNDLANILQDMEMFTDSINHGNTDMEGF